MSAYARLSAIYRNKSVAGGRGAGQGGRIVDLIACIAPKGSRSVAAKDVRYRPRSRHRDATRASQTSCVRRPIAGTTARGRDLPPESVAQYPSYGSATLIGQGRSIGTRRGDETIRARTQARPTKGEIGVRWGVSGWPSHVGSGSRLRYPLVAANCFHARSQSRSAGEGSGNSMESRVTRALRLPCWQTASTS
jgi:hypothetical protein